MKSDGQIENTDELQVGNLYHFCNTIGTKGIFFLNELCVLGNDVEIDVENWSVLLFLGRGRERLVGTDKKTVVLLQFLYDNRIIYLDHFKKVSNGEYFLFYKVEDDSG